MAKNEEMKTEFNIFGGCLENLQEIFLCNGQ